MKNKENNTYFVTKIIPMWRSIYKTIGTDWILADEYHNIIIHSPNMDEILIKANLMGIENKNIYLLVNDAVGSVNKYLSNDYHFKKMKRILQA